MALGFGSIGGRVLDKLVVQLSAKEDLAGLDKFEKAADQLLGKLDKLAGVALGVGTVAAAGVAGALKAFGGLEAKIAEVAAKTGLTLDGLKSQYFDDLREIQRETGRADFELWDGLQKAISAGLEGDAALDAVRTAARSAAAGIGEIGDQVSSATTLLEVFDVTAGTALDVVARAAQVGEGETEHFSQALKGLGAVADSLNFSLYEVAGGLAAISRTAKSVPEGETQFRAFITSLTRATARGQKALDELEIGLTYAGLREIGDRKGLAALLRTLRDAVGDDVEKMTAILGSTEALQFVYNVDPAQLAELTADLEATAPGTIFRAFGEGADLSVRKMEQLRKSIGNAFEDLGKYLDPILGKLLDLGLRISDAFLGMPEGVKRLTAYLLGLGAALLPIGGAVKIFTKWKGASGVLEKALKGLAGGVDEVGGALGKSTKKAGLLARALPAVLNPAALIAAGLAGLALIVAKWDAVKDVARKAWHAVKDFFSADRRRRKGIEDAAEASNRLLTALEAQLAVLREQEAPAARIAEVEGRITAEKERQLALQQALKAEEALQAVRQATEVALPGLSDKLDSTREARAAAQRKLDRGYTGDNQWAMPLSPERRAEIEDEIVVFDADLAGLEARIETLQLQAVANLEVLRGDDVDPRLRAAGASAARAFGEGFREAGIELRGIALETFEKAFGPVLPQSDARTGVFSGLTRAGEAIGETMAAGLRRTAPLLTAALAGVALPELEPVRQTVEQTVRRAVEVVEAVEESQPVATVERVLEPVAETLAEAVQPVARVLEPVAETLAEAVQPVARVLEPVGDSIPGAVQPVSRVVEPVADTALPRLLQVVDQVLEPLGETAMAVFSSIVERPEMPNLPELSQRIVYALDRLPEVDAFGEIAATFQRPETAEALAALAMPPDFTLPTTHVPIPGGAEASPGGGVDNRSYSLTIEDGAIRVEGGRDGREIGREIAGEMRRGWLTLVEQADSVIET